MDRKVLLARAEIVFAVILIVVVTVGIAFFAFRSMPSTNTTENTPNADPLFGEEIKFLDLNDKTEFDIASKKVILPANSKVQSAYNKTNNSIFKCQNDISSDCTIYEIETNGRIFYMSAPLPIELKAPTSVADVEKTLITAGEEVEYTYTQRKFVKATTNTAGEVEILEDVPEETNIEEIHGCLKSGICFNSGILINEKAENDIEVAAFEQFVQSIVIQ